jgi:uncharacterized phosphosugar-binding protein
MEEAGMTSFARQYFDGVIQLLRQIADEEAEALQAGARLMADAIEQGKRIFAFGCTHSSLPIQDLVYRAGGLMLINPLFGPGIASLDVHPPQMTSAIERLSGYAKALLDTSPMGAGDVLILVSVSGRNAVPVELAEEARKSGVRVIGVTSRRYTDAFPSRHPSGKKMYQHADVVLDNKVEAGDAFLQAKGAPQKFCPASGVTSTAVLQALVAATVEELLARGITPPIYLAANVEGGMDYNARMLEKYKDRIVFG